MLIKLTYSLSLIVDIALSYLPAFKVFKSTYPTRSSRNMSHWSIVPLSSISKVSSTYLTFPPKDIFSTYLACSFYDMYLFILSFHTVLSCLFSLTFLKFSSPKSSHSSVLYIFSLRFHFDIPNLFYPCYFTSTYLPFSPPPPLTYLNLVYPWDFKAYYIFPLRSHIDISHPPLRSNTNLFHPPLDISHRLRLLLSNYYRRSNSLRC